MREILFRGKKKDNGEWVEGAYYHQSEFYGDEWSADYIITTKDELEDNMMIRERVIPETVGQYTGLCDKNGKKIFEGDILESRASENSEDWKRWLCIYHDGSFCFEREFGKRKKKYEQNLLCEDEIDLYGLEVIGNIHDNPELLKGGAE